MITAEVQRNKQHTDGDELRHQASSSTIAQFLLATILLSVLHNHLNLQEDARLDCSGKHDAALERVGVGQKGIRSDCVMVVIVAHA